MKKRSVLISVLLVILWYFLSRIVQNEFILPSPDIVMRRMVFDIADSNFYYIVFTSLLRLLKGIIVSLIIGIPLGLAAGLSDKVSDYMQPINAIIKAVPNMSYMIILLIWVGAENSVIFVSFFVLFPLVFTNVQMGIKQMEQSLKNALRVYAAPFLTRLKGVYMPQILPQIYSSLKVGCGLGLRVCIMAEVLSQVKVGVGKQIYFARNILDMSAIFSWTIWMILLSIAMEVILEKLKFLFKVKD
jgi:ABC-type nitrate/sulfonate/bicarbonate transport system, permease component